MTFRHCSHYELSVEDRSTIAKMLTILDEFESEMNSKQSERITDGSFDIITASQIDEIAETLQDLLDYDEEDIYLE